LGIDEGKGDTGGEVENYKGIQGEGYKIIKSTPEQRVLRFIQAHRLATSGERLLVAVSGGPDSVCLLHILVKLQKELNVKLHVAHLNHQLRGAESEADAAYVADLARRLGVPATVAWREEHIDHSTTHAETIRFVNFVSDQILA